MDVIDVYAGMPDSIHNDASTHVVNHFWIKISMFSILHMYYPYDIAR